MTVFRDTSVGDADRRRSLLVMDVADSTAITVTGAELTNSQPLHVAIVDGSGSQISSFGGGTQYAELATTSPGTGTLALGRYKLTPPTLTDGQLYGLQLDSAGALKVSGTVIANNFTAADLEVVAFGYDGSTQRAMATTTTGVVKVTTLPASPFNATENHATAQTNNELVAAPGGGLALYVTSVIFSNGATAGSIKLLEDTGGTPAVLIQETYLGINGGAVIDLPTPIRVSTNKNLGFTSTTVTTHSVTVTGYTAA